MTRRSFASALLALVVLAAGCEPPPSAKPIAPRPHVQPPAKRPVLLVFTASWCGACQRQRPVLAEIRATGAEVNVYDVDENPAMAQEYGVTILPTYILHLIRPTPIRTHDAAEVLAILKNR
jgi:thiol-disulfide isomerase/thioredoxin